MFNMEHLRSKLLLKAMKGFGRQPWWLLHLESSIVACVMSTIGGYRKKVVLSNLNKVFGKEKASKLAKGFYRNFCDITVESMKLFTVSDKSLINRVEYSSKGLQLMNRLYDDNRIVILAGGHMASWEMYAVTFSQKIKFDSMALYKKLSDPIIDKEMRISRERLGLKMVEISECKKWMENHMARSENTRLTVGFGFDQSPPKANTSWWTKFLGVDTAVYFGIEKWAKDYNAAVVYGAVKRVGRGRYSVDFRLVKEHVLDSEKGEVVDRCLGELEREIREAPSDWLWSHKRWKHTKPEGMIIQERRFECKLDS
jgi:KDO2-lipid IV(A) lauroyltransferase|tara:strand:+ start:1007 stop:1942 length:936 start_codon:yes stop_codon:yes gene_type:complete